MDDLISRQAVLSKAYFHGEQATWDNPNPSGVDAVDVEEIEALPTIDAVEEVKYSEDDCTGCKWEDAFGYGECHRCRRRLEDMYESR